MKKIRIECIRFREDSESVKSHFRVYEDEKEVFKCFCLEEKNESLESGKDTRIPADTYKLSFNRGSRFNERFQKWTNRKNVFALVIHNDKVNYKRFITIHSGNSNKDTLGCPLLGYTDTKNWVGDSRIATTDFYNLIYDYLENGVKLDDIDYIVKNEF